jgi:hypothetical protein
MQASSPSKSPIFIVGCSRSGTTLLQSLLDAHPNIVIPPEGQIYFRFGETFPYYGKLSDDRNRRRFIRDLLQDAYLQKWNLNCSVEEVEQVASSFTRAGIIEAVYCLYMCEKGAKRWGDKTPEHIRYLPLIKEDFPDAYLIHLVRDGRDVAEALKRMIFGPVSALGLGRFWRREVMHWREFQEQRGPDNMLEVRYEDLVSSPEQLIGRILAFIGEPYVDTTSSYADSDVSQLVGSESWHSSLQEDITTDKIGVYRQQLSERDVELFEYVAGDALEAYGYRPEYRDPSGPSVFDQVHAFTADRVVRWYRKAFEMRVFAWDIQYRSRKLLRYLQWKSWRR